MPYLENVQVLKQAKINRLQSKVKFFILCCRSGNIAEATSIFFQSKQGRDILLSRIHCHVLMDALIHSAEYAMVYSVYRRMTEMGITSTQGTYSRIFKACAQDSVAWYEEHKHLIPSVATPVDKNSFLARKKCSDSRSNCSEEIVSYMALLLRNDVHIADLLVIGSPDNLLDDFGGPGLDRARKLWLRLKDGEGELTRVTYNSLMHALAKGGDLAGCLSVLDRMTSTDGLTPDSFTLTAVLSAIAPAATRRQLAALRPSPGLPCSRMDSLQLALTLWHTLVPRLPPSSNTFPALASVSAVALLDAVGHRDAGPVQLTLEPTQFVLRPGDRACGRPFAIVGGGMQEDTPQIYSSADALAGVGREVTVDWGNTELALFNTVNLLRLESQNITVNPPKNGWLPWHRLALLGGLHGFLEVLRDQYSIQPCLRLLMKLVQMSPPPTVRPAAQSSLPDKMFDEWEEQLLFVIPKAVTSKNKLIPDMGLFNALIHRRTSVGQSADHLLREATRRGLMPDQITWGSLAAGCRTVDQAKQLLQAYARASAGLHSNNHQRSSRSSLRPGLVLFTSLLSASRFNWDLKSYLLGEHMSTWGRQGPGGAVLADRRLIAGIEVEIGLFRELLLKDLVPKAFRPDMATELEAYVGHLHKHFQGTVNVITSDGRTIIGTLKGFDNVINLVIKDSQERVFSPTEGVEHVPLGLFIIRGQNVAVVGELDEDLDRRIDFASLRAEPLNPVLH